jgi:hypothetical protein
MRTQGETWADGGEWQSRELPMKLFVAVKSLNTFNTSRARTQTEKRVAGAVTLVTLLLLTACGGGGGGGGSGGSSTTPNVMLSANPASVTANQTATQTWSSSNVTSCTASGAWSGSKPTSGSEPTGSLSATSTFELSCNGAAGTATASTTVTVENAPDTTPPSVSIAPANSSKVLVSTLIHAVFSEDVDPSTINEVSFQLTGPGGPIAGSRSYANRIATFTPAAALEIDKSYTATVTTAVKDLAGNALPQNVSSTFTTFAGTPLTSACAGVYGGGFKLVSGLDNSPVPALAKPTKGPGITEPTYKTCLVRVTDYAAEGLAGFARNDYSRRQAFNADSTKLVIYAGDGTWHLYDATTYAHIKELPGLGGDAEPQWHPTKSNILYYIPSSGIGMKLYQLNVDTGVSQVVADFGAKLKSMNLWPAAQAVWTGAEGSPSRLLTTNADHPRYWAFMADGLDQNFDHVTLGLFTFDLETGEIIGTYDLASHGKGSNGGPDHISMSPSGNYVVVSWYSADGGPVAYQREFTSPVNVDSGSNHSDLVFGENGEEYYVAIDFYGDTGKLFMANLATGVRTDLVDTYLNGTYTSAHFSGKAYDRPGWLLVSTYSDDWGSNRQWLHYKVFVVQLKENPAVLQLAHHHSTFGPDHTGLDYWSEPQASVNRDFTRVIFNSNWGSTNYDDVDAYLIELPADAIAAP